jgi:hypothetical protein
LVLVVTPQNGSYQRLVLVVENNDDLNSSFSSSYRGSTINQIERRATCTHTNLIENGSSFPMKHVERGLGAIRYRDSAVEKI